MHSKAAMSIACQHIIGALHILLSVRLNEPTGLGRTGKSSPIFLLLATFTDLPAPANKYLNAIINKCERVGKTKKRRVEVEFMEGAKCIWAWGRFLGADCRWRWVK